MPVYKKKERMHLQNNFNPDVGPFSDNSPRLFLFCQMPKVETLNFRIVSVEICHYIWYYIVLTFDVFAGRNCLLNNSRNADMFSVEDFKNDEWA